MDGNGGHNPAILRLAYHAGLLGNLHRPIESGVKRQCFDNCSISQSDMTDSAGYDRESGLPMRVIADEFQG